MGHGVCHKWAWGLLLGGVVATRLAGAMEAGPGEAGLSFDEALRLADQSPAVVTALASAREKREGDAHVSRMTANPQVTAQLGYRREDVKQGFDAQASLLQGFHLEGYGAARRRSVTAEEAVLDADAEAVRLRQRLWCARSWLALWGATQAHAEAEREVDLAGELLARSERAAAAGALTQVDVSEARAYLAEARLAALGSEGEVFDLGLELARSMGRTATEPPRLVGSPPELLAGKLAPALRERLLASAGALPEVRSRLQGERAERLRAAEARAQRGAQLSVGAQWFHEPSAPYTLLGTLQLQLPLFDHGERESTDYLASAERLRGAAADAQRSAESELVAMMHELDHSREIWEELTLHLVPAAENTVRLRERMLAVGEGTVLEALLARRSLAAAQGRAARARATLSYNGYRLWFYGQLLGIADLFFDGTSPKGVP
jgi:outer membrane protein TolC